MPQIGVRPRGPYWLRMLGWSFAAATFATVVFAGVTWRTPWSRTLQAFGVSCVFTACIVPLAAFVIPRVAHRVFNRLRFPFDWMCLIATMVVAGMVGSLMAVGILAGVGYIDSGRAVGAWLNGSLRVSVIMTLIFGVAISAVEALRGRLEAATIALRTKERDEAEARRMAAEAQLAALESRVNPHFLFNTLNSITELIHRDPDGAERMTTQLASLLRSSLDQVSPLTPFADELRTVRDYLEIERVRFGDRLAYDIAVDDQLGEWRVPRLSVQTLVENSVKHAISERREGGAITVRASRVAGRLSIEVGDDGPGFDTSALRPGHGLDLLKSRLSAIFGADASLRIASAPGSTRITIDIPGTTNGRDTSPARSA